MKILLITVQNSALVMVSRAQLMQNKNWNCATFVLVSISDFNLKQTPLARFQASTGKFISRFAGVYATDLLVIHS